MVYAMVYATVYYITMYVGTYILRLYISTLDEIEKRLNLVIMSSLVDNSGRSASYSVPTFSLLILLYLFRFGKGNNHSLT